MLTWEFFFLNGPSRFLSGPSVGIHASCWSTLRSVCMYVCVWLKPGLEPGISQSAGSGENTAVRKNRPPPSLHLRVASGFSFPFFWISGSFFRLELFSSALSLPWSTRGFVFTGGNSSGSALLRTDATPNKVTETRPDTCCGACALESLCWFRTEPERRGTLMDH